MGKIYTKQVFVGSVKSFLLWGHFLDKYHMRIFMYFFKYIFSILEEVTILSKLSVKNTFAVNVKIYRVTLQNMYLKWHIYANM